MKILGLNGSFDPCYPTQDPARDFRMIDSLFYLNHDGAAVLVENGGVLAAIEEERLNRLKHSNRFAMHAIRACLKTANVRWSQVDYLAYHSKESALDRFVAVYMLYAPHVTLQWTGRDVIVDAFRRHLDLELDPGRIIFVEHHQAHAMSAYAMSSFDSALVVTLDGQGDGLAGTVWSGDAGRLTRLAELAEPASLGHFYLEAIRYLGYDMHDEYKVMGLAPYGNPARFRSLFEKVCVLHDDGSFSIHRPQLLKIADAVRPRRVGEPMTNDHADVAAALQEALERAAIHYIDHFRRATGLKNLCLAGGVAHNSTLNGRLASSGLFDGIFVQPASHDAGTALGAALVAQQLLEPTVHFAPLQHLYWGTDIGVSAEIGAALDRWRPMIEITQVADPADVASGLIANGEVIGWVQGRSEFGPRALGNRSILADARPAANKDRINALVKQREGYRPFAPSVLEEHAAEYFIVPPGARPAFMTFVVPVREEYRELLGAVTHVDGSARVQTVSKQDNPRFWRLIERFGRRTGVPIVLNTSFNHNVEPIVDSVDDAVTCLLTTALDHLIVGDFHVRVSPRLSEAITKLSPQIPKHVRVLAAYETDREGVGTMYYRCENTCAKRYTAAISRDCFDVLTRADGVMTLHELFGARPAPLPAIIDEITALWRERLVLLTPPPSAAAAQRQSA